MNIAALPRVDLPVFGPIAQGLSREEAVSQLARITKAIRRRDAVMIVDAGAGHIWGDFSVLDILTTLYFAVMDYDPLRPDDPQRDRLVLSKGHAAGSLYATFAALGLINPEELSTFMQPFSRLNGHPDRNKVIGIEANTGPL